MQLAKHPNTSLACNSVALIILANSFTAFVGYKPTRKFVFCLSRDSDSLNMWNYYVRNGAYQGYNIGFNIPKLLKTFDTPDEHKLDSFSVYYGNVLYNKKDQFTEILHFFAETEQNLKKAQTKSNPEIAESVVKYIFRSQLDTYGVFFKHPKFQQEKEFRIVIDIYDEHIPRKKGDAEKYFGKNNKNLMEGFYTRNGMIIPFLGVTLPEDCISKMTISPITEFDVTKSSLHEVLKISGFKKVKVEQSDIPIRY